jgi:hypothetical protein
MLVMNPYSGPCAFEYTNGVMLHPIAVTVQPPDLAVAAFLVPPVVTGAPQPEVTVVTCLTNRGTGPVASEWTDRVYLSVTPFLDVSVAPGGFWPRTNHIPAGGCLWFTNNFHLPATDSGNYYLIYRGDADDAILESSEINNEAVAPVHLDLSLMSDLAIVSFSAPRRVTGPPYPTIEVSWVVENQGLGLAPGPWSDQIWMESNDMPAIPLGTYWQSESLAVGERYERVQPIQLPITRSGSYALMLRANASQDQPGWPSTISQTLWIDYVRTLETPLFLQAEGFEADGFHLSVHGETGRNYRLLASEDLLHWQRLLDFRCTDGTASLVDTSTRGKGQRFYQVVSWFVPEPLRLSFAPEGVSSNSVGLVLDGPPAAEYRIEASDNLREWTVVTTRSGATTPIRFEDPAPLREKRFYRAVQEAN